MVSEIVFQFFNEFIVLTVRVIPFFIAGTVFAALLASWTKLDFIGKYLNKGLVSVINASLLGSLLPGCACATIPMAEGLKKKGASLGTLASFIMVAALLAPHTIILTYGLLGLKFTVARIVFSLAGAILLGVTFNYFQNKNIKGFELSTDANQASDDKECCSSCSPAAQTSTGFWKNFFIISKDLGKYFLLGMIIASVLTTFVPEDAVGKYIGSSGPLAYLGAALIGIPLYVCEGEEIPITLALLNIGLGQGPALTFLLGSVGTCIPTILMAQKVIGRRPTLVYVAGWFVFAIFSGVLFSVL
ncbi:MAG: permease [Candidatus Omnitrophica bacterium]|nr:permease [Candidatus Omnitrophota bacterium]